MIGVLTLLALLGVGTAGAGFYDELGTAVCIPQSPEGKCLFVKGISDLPNPCLAKMEALLTQLELDFTQMEQRRSTIPMWELRAMLQRRPMWTDAKTCWEEARD